MKLKVTFDIKWILNGAGSNTSTVRKIARVIKQKYGSDIKIKSESLNDLIVEFDNGVDSAALKENVRKLIFEHCPEIREQPNVFNVVIEADIGEGLSDVDRLRMLINSAQAKAGETSETDSAQSPAPAHDFTPGPTPPVEAPDIFTPADRTEQYVPGTVSTPGFKTSLASNKKADEVMKEIDGMIGVDDFKSLCREIHLQAPLVRKNHTEDVFRSKAFLFAVDTGGGFTYSVELLKKLLEAEEIIPEGTSIKKLAVPDPHSDSLQGKLNNLAESLSESNGLTVLDLNSWSGYTVSPDFKDFLVKLLINDKGKRMIIFRCEYMKESSIESLRRDIADVWTVRPVIYQPFDSNEIRSFAESMLSKYHFETDDEVWPLFDRIVENEKRDGCFYGIHTIQKVVNSLIHSTELYNVVNNINSNRITVDSVTGLLPKNYEDDSLTLDTFNELVGLEEVAAKVREVINQIRFARQNNMTKIPAMHMSFEGNPGTGKTTVARIIGNVLKQYGVLRIGNFYEHKARDLCGQYVGHTAPLTTNICRQAYGSVLFIDEAYALAYDRNGKDYGQEAIDTLIAEMENHADDFMVIFAGYTDDMQRLLDMNPGLRSRIPYTIHFSNYSGEQLHEIFMRQLKSSGFKCSDDFDEHVKDYFMRIPQNVLEDKNFGNARFVRNVFERTWSKALAREEGKSLDSVVLVSDDFDSAIWEFDEIVKSMGRTVSLGFQG